MPSILPILTYSTLSQDKDSSAQANPLSNGSVVSSQKTLKEKETRSAGKDTEGRRKIESSSTGGKKSGKKKRRPAKKVSSRHGVLDEDQVEEVVAKATAHAQAVQAVKKAILEIQLFLLDGVQHKARLQATSRLLTQSEYSDVVTERSISKQCGYPLCHNGLVTESSRKGRYRISLQEHKVYDLSETRLFCCANCLVASKTFQSSLQIERDAFISKEKLLRIMDSIRDPKTSIYNANGDSKDNRNETVPSNESLVSGIQEREDSGISSFDDSGPSDAIEGYVPQNSIRQRPLDEISHQSENPRSDRVKSKTDQSTLNVNPTADNGEVPLTPDEQAELDGDFPQVPRLKSALKNGTTEKIFKRSVSWEDQKKRAQKSERKEQSARLKEESQVPTPTNSPPPSPSTASVSPTPQETPTVADAVSFSNDAGKTEVNSNPPEEQISSCPGVTPSVEDPLENPAVLAESGKTQKSERVLSAEAVAAALTQAAEAAAGGEIGSEEAVALAGLSIVPVTEDVEVSQPINAPTETSIYDLEEQLAGDSDPVIEVDVRWPIPEPPEEDDLDFTTAKGAWHSTPPRNFKVEVSMFGTIWIALEEWISAATIAHIYGKESQDEDEFVVANGREFQRQVHDADSTSTQISKTFSTCISRAFPDVVKALRLNVPISTLEKNIGRLVRTMTFVEALPAFTIKHWGMILMLLLDGLSVRRLPAVGVHLTNNISLLRKFLDSTGTSEAEYDTFRDLLLPLGRLPPLSTGKGG